MYTPPQSKHEKHFIFIPGQNSYRCTYASPLSAILTLKYNSSLSRVPLGFSGNKEDGVYNFQLTSKTKTKFNFRYQASNQKLTNNLTLELICQDREDLEQYEISKTVNVEKCESGSTFYCGSANLKGEKLNCTLRVVRKPGKRGREAYYGENIYFTNTEEAPLEPVDVRDSYNTNDNNIQIDSKKPINTNGELKGFEIRYIEATISKKRLQENKLQSNVKNSTSASFTISTFSFEPCTQHFLQVRAVNNYSPGFASTKLTTSPPLLPNYLKIKKLKERITSVDFSFETPPKQISNDQEIIQYLLVLLTGTKKKCNKLKSMKIMNHEGLQNVSSIAREFDLTKVPVNVTVQFTIGDKTTGKSKYLNCDLENGPLEAKKTHQVAFLAISRCAYNSKKYVYTFDVTTGETEDTKLNISVIFYIILSIIWFLVGVASAISFKRYRERKRPKIMYGIGRRPTTVDNIYSLSDLPRILPKIPESDKEELLESHQNEFTTFPVAYRANLDFKKPIKIREFEKYVQNGVSKELEAQFLSLPKGALQPSVEGKQELNKPKNRFNNILPYDFNRVKLQRTSENTDYINASFIKGYKMNQSYIAAQGPKSLTINDFWQMIWQENVRYVVMLVNLEEAGQKKVEKYWPNPNEDFRFGNIQVFHHSADCMADYEINVFTVTCDGQQRKVFHYHFLKWPDHGVPMHFHTLVSFVRKSLEISLRSPVVVHCSSGTAATGVFILCDICLRAAHETGIVDMFKIAYDLRKQRINMIDNILQYKLAHLVVMEVLTGLQSVISCNDDVDKFTVKLTSPDELMLQMQYLEDTCWHNKVLQIPVGLDYPYEVFPKKNKTINIIPDETEAIQLRRYPPSDKSSAYINAVKVDGYNYQNKYIVTQQPMPNTLNDFWRMIVLLDVETIVSLNEVDLTDEKSCEFWPTDTNPQMSPVDFIMLKYSSHTESENFTKIGVQVHVEGKEKKIMKVNIISLKGWPTHNMFPDDLHNFLKFHCYIDVIMKQFPKCCVTCYDGNLACGLFVATSYIIEKIKLEKCYNVCEAIKIIRKNRKEFITDKKQLAYLYEIASTYIKGFETYANFSKTSSALINIYDYIE
ncbi:hypothetical protein WA026_020829 [Henosepilachna vigintioctopunctata]|uniref:protein-tyrosine-phosphatase n=1 Tax=Henosepilachna vigintioctopunctata TaxID=420089 RepID=A0AAW1TRY5_9CUCU